MGRRAAAQSASRRRRLVQAARQELEGGRAPAPAGRDGQLRKLEIPVGVPGLQKPAGPAQQSVPRDKASLLRAGRCTRGSQGRGGSMPLPALTARFKERCPRPLPSWGAASLPSDPGSSGPHVVALWPSPPQCGAAAPTPFLCCFFLTTVISNWPWGGAPVPAPVARRSLPRRLLPNRYLQL